MRSPKFINRGALGRTINGCLAVIEDSPLPNRLPVSTATAVMRYRVRLSGNFTSTVTWPVESVFADGAKTAKALKFCRKAIATWGSSSCTLLAAIFSPLVLRLCIGRLENDSAETDPAIDASAETEGGGGTCFASSGLPSSTSFLE